MNKSIIQFVAGIVLGVLFTLSVVYRMPKSWIDSSTSTSSSSSSSSGSSFITSTSNRAPTIDAFQSLFPSAANPFNSTITGTIERQKVPWTPGSKVPIEKLKQIADKASQEFATQSSVSTTVSDIPTISVPSQADLISSSAINQQEHIERKHRRERHKKRDGGGAHNAWGIGGDVDRTGGSNFTGGSVEMFDVVTGQRVAVENAAPSGIYLPYPPMEPYHSQAHNEHPLKPPFVPSLQSVEIFRKSDLAQQLIKAGKLKNKPLPNMTLQKAPYEVDNLKLHLCNGVYEAYSAAWLTTKEHVLAVKSEGYNLSWVNCEMASFIHMREHRNFLANAKGPGMIMQSLDVLDFSAIHLSAFERSSKKYKDKLWQSRADRNKKWSEIDAVKAAARELESLINPAKTGKPLIWSEEAKKTVVIMPFLGGAMGAGHSELGNRFEYLKACFWSFYEFIPNIVAGVTRQEDVQWGLNESGLPFFDVILIPNLPKSASLPVATTQQTKARLLSGEWDFDYVFFTESDQILISRILPLLYDTLKSYPRRMLLPHRLMPYSDRVIQEVHKKNVEKSVRNKWMEQSCCLPRQNCEERATWVPLAHEMVPVINYYGLYVPLGNVNFLSELYRSCTMMEYVGDYCP